jgi:hypothetical protein
MHVSMLGILAFGLALLAWSAMGHRCRQLVRCRRTRRAEWNELVRNYSDLDRELDQVWHGRLTGSGQ